jgi:hypothetical protein
MVSRSFCFAFLAPRAPFRQPGKQHQNRTGPQEGHREYQCDRFLRAHKTILRARGGPSGGALEVLETAVVRSGED